MKKILGIFVMFSVMILAGCGSSAVSEPTATPTPIPIGVNEDLAAIIASAQDGEILYLGEGTYQLAEGLTIQKSLTIIGAGMDKTIITTSTPIVFTRTTVSDEGEKQVERYAMLNFDVEGDLTLEGLTLSYSGTDPGYVLHMNNGNLKMDDCRLQSASRGSEEVPHYAILILDNDAVAHVESCIFEGNDIDLIDRAPNGIAPTGTSQIEMTNSQISDVYFGFVSYESALATLIGNTFSNIGEYAIVLRNTSSLSANQNEIAGDEQIWGFVCINQGNMVLEENKINDTAIGIFFDDACGGQAAKNEISNNTYRGIVVQGTAAPILEENTISVLEGIEVTNDLIGIFFSENGSGTITGNTIKGFYFGIDIQGNATATLEENTLTSNEYAISFFNNSSGTVRGNIMNSKLAGIFVRDSANVILENNTIIRDGNFEDTAETSQGITFMDQSSGTAANNQVSGYYLGILANTLSTVGLQENTITSCKFGMTFNGYTTIDTTAIGNKISQCEMGIEVNEIAAPILEGNEIFSNTWAFDIASTSNPVLNDNNIHDNTYNE